MHTKGKYVKDLHINTNYSIDLIDINNKKINLESLSAGEKQLLVASIIFSMYKVSNRNNVFILILLLRDSTKAIEKSL